MSAKKVAAELISKMNETKYKLIVLNFANSDMVGHTGNIKAAAKAVEAVDACLDRLVKATLAKGGALLITLSVLVLNIVARVFLREKTPG